jgi:hypothetical protein
MAPSLRIDSHTYAASINGNMVCVNILLGSDLSDNSLAALVPMVHDEHDEVAVARRYECSGEGSVTGTKDRE